MGGKEILNIVGIHLGTTFSSVAILSETGRPHIIPTADGDRIMPSAVLAPYFPAGETEVTIESIEFRINSVLDFIFLKGKIENIN